MNFKLMIACWLVFGLTRLQAQEATVTSGGEASGIGGNISYSVGQTFYTTSSSAVGTVAAGVQQAFEITIITGIEQANAVTLQCSTYPNPATDFVILSIGNYKAGDVSYQLYDLAGKLLQKKQADDKETTISMKALVPGTYFLKVSNNHKEVKTFKIIKN